MTTAARLALLLLAGALAACPLAAAESGQVTADGVGYRGGARQHGSVAAYFLSTGATADSPVPNPLDPPPAPGEVPVVGLEIKAERIEALAMAQHTLLVGGQARAEDPRQDNEAAPERVVLDEAQARLAAQQEVFQLHILPAEEGQLIPFQAHGESGTYETYGSLAMGTGKFRPAQGVDTDDPRAPDAVGFWSVVLDTPLVVNADDAAQQDITFVGDLVLEMHGLTLEAQDADEAAVLESGRWTTETVPGAVAQETSTLLRLFLTDAQVRISVQGGSPDLYFASPDLVSEQDGDVTLLGATGVLVKDGEASDYRQDRVLLGAGNTLTVATADAARLRLGVEPTPALAPAAATGGFVVRTGPTLWAGLAAVLALAVAVGLGLVRSLGEQANLAAVEAAIEASRYGRAARIAKRILRARPGDEDAILGRAIALSKSGRAGRAIDELQAHLASRGSTDGSLHYVLGLSLLDVGRVEDARAALSHAATQTPALAADIAARLGPNALAAPAPAPRLGREAGYA